MTTLKQLVTVALATTLTIATQAQTSTTSGAKPTTKTTTTVKTTPAKTTTTTKPSTAKTTTTVKKTATKTTSTVKKATTTTPAKTNSQSSSAATTTTTGKTPQTIDNTNTGKTIKTGTLERPGNTTSGTTTGGKPNLNNDSNTNTGGKPNLGGDTNNQNTNNNTNTGGKPNLGNQTDNNNQGNNIINTITEGEASSAIKEALMKGIQVGVDKVSVTDGFFKNSMIKILFPNEVRQVESTLRSVGMGSLADNMIMSMNRAAEQASKQAGPIFINSIKQMTVTDAVNIVSNQQSDAATQFLKRTTTESLVASFKPTIKTALDQTLATKYWADITSYYNRIPLVSPVNTDLPDYVTRKAIDGLFIMVAQEEAQIRKNPIGTGNEIIDKVFGSVRKR